MRLIREQTINSSPIKHLLQTRLFSQWIYIMIHTIMILSFQTDRSEQCRHWSDCSWWSSLIKISNVCHSVFIFWTHLSMVKQQCSYFRIITTFFSADQMFWIFNIVTRARTCSVYRKCWGLIPFSNPWIHPNYITGSQMWPWCGLGPLVKKQQYQQNIYHLPFSTSKSLAPIQKISL